MKLSIISCITICLLALTSCSKQPNCDIADVESNSQICGELKLQEYTTWMYGTHYIMDGQTYYALKSSMNLAAYENQQVCITGPIEMQAGQIKGGPTLIDVQTIQ